MAATDERSSSPLSEDELVNRYSMLNAESNEVSYKWIDISNEFLTNVKDLHLGELLHDEMFGLLEAMSAIEMMDPKMDAGMVCNRGSKKALSFEQAVESGNLKLKDLTAAEQIGIIDSTWACLVSWLEGHSLAQTVFTNLYLHKPYQIEDRPMKAFSIAILKIVDSIRDFITKALVFEEEDFQLVTYGFRLVPDITETRALGMLREVEDELSKKMKASKARILEHEPKNAELISQHEDSLALYSRIKFTRTFYMALAALGRREQTMEQGRYLGGCSELLVVIQKTVERGIKPAPVSSNTSSNRDLPTIMGFDPLVNQRLLPPTFPRYTKIKSRDEALEYFEALIQRLKMVTKISSYSSFHAALDFFIDFSRNSPCILSRSILQLLYLPHYNRVLGAHNFTDILRDAAKTFICPPALMPKSTLLNNQQAKEYVDTFFGHCVRPLGTLIQISGHNRARQRDKLAHLLEDFAGLQDEAERVDAFLHNLSLKSDNPRPHLACLGTWILYHALRVMIMYLLSGFELELYSIHEYHYIYWYLYEFLYGWLVSSLSRADSFIMEQEAAKEMEKASGRSSKKSKAKRKNRVRPYGREITMAQVLLNMCGGYYKAMVGLRLEDKIQMPHYEFDDERVRYEHRFAPFASLITPPIMHYQEFIEMTSNAKESQNSIHYYLSGADLFHQARSFLEGLPFLDFEGQELLKICKTNFVVLKLLGSGHKRESPVELDFSGHQHFPVIKV
ncbi:N-alpha-acetyltransferase 35, NatC auxiliary subunit [Neocloeon triangulifer]|uniref:N-alpha-acetyltransferase 35, NatC auxiliary subunit n=1 Tax=Neocloeon triangulifer TaxID=2078957 RepID=UPI00286EF192|nr:N-alpha-acetyltransferase 35, NatC auxiliary subunit [Neocloeon triangulifer]